MVIAVVMEFKLLQCYLERENKLSRGVDSTTISSSRADKTHKLISSQLGWLHSSVGGTSSFVNPLRPNSDLSQTSYCNIKGLSVSEVMRIENMITQVKFY